MKGIWRIKPVGDQALLVVFEQKIAEHVNAQVMALDKRIRQERPKGVLETVPAFASILVYYDPMETETLQLMGVLEGMLRADEVHASFQGKLIEIPVCYGGRYGEDLDFVAEHAGLSVREVIEIHSKRDYLIYMLGFLPGFPYLGGMDERIFTPRLSVPRTKIPAGSVGIGGEQTGVYPVESPGGWQLIGRTPLRLFQPDNGGKLLYEAGDRIRFVPITEEEFLRMEQTYDA